MPRKFYRIFLLILCLTIISSVTNAANHWRLDADKDKSEPRSFRLMTDSWHREIKGSEPPREGLDALRMSAGGQPSLATLSWLRDKITVASSAPAQIYIVDLRQESHGYVNGLPVSWRGKHNIANHGKSTAEVLQDEKKWLNSLIGRTIEFVPMGKTDTKLFGSHTVKVDAVQTEEEAVRAAGMNYARFAVPDGEWADNPQTIDDFLTFVKNLPPEAWLHFHCHAGHGRTTTFAVMYDKLQNPKIPIEMIVSRQYLLDGTDLLAENKANNHDGIGARHRAEMIRLFGKYVESDTDLSWSQWMANNRGNKK